MSTRTHYAWLALASATLVACGGSGGDSGQPFQRDNDTPPAVEAVEIMLGSLPLEERFAGSVRARNQTEIFAEVSAAIEAVYVDDGDRVAAGDPLVQLRAREFEERVRQAESGLLVAEARVRQAEAQLVRIHADLARSREIVSRGLGSQAELDLASADAASAEADLDLVQAQRQQAAAALEEQRAALADTLVRAPIDGIVGSRNAEVGQQANTSSALFTIGDINRMEVNITLTQEMLSYISIATPVNIYAGTTRTAPIQAAVTRISPYLHPVTHTTQAQIHVDDPESLLRPGMYVTVDVLYGQTEQAPLVPNSALYRHPRDGREGVFLMSLDEAARSLELSGPSAIERPLENPVGPVAVRFVPVEVVARGRMSSGVTGIEPGDWVVTLGHHLLDDADEHRAIVQPTPWDHILVLQRLENRDLLDIIRDKQEQSEALNFTPNVN